MPLVSKAAVWRPQPQQELRFWPLFSVFFEKMLHLQYSSRKQELGTVNFVVFQLVCIFAENPPPSANLRLGEDDLQIRPCLVVFGFGSCG